MDPCLTVGKRKKAEDRPPKQPSHHDKTDHRRFTSTNIFSCSLPEFYVFICIRSDLFSYSIIVAASFLDR